MEPVGGGKSAAFRERYIEAAGEGRLQRYVG